MERRGHRPLGLFEGPEPEPACLVLAMGQPVLITSDGVSERRTEPGGSLGLEGIPDALRRAAATPATTASALARAVIECSSSPARDDATVLVLGGDGFSSESR